MCMSSIIAVFFIISSVFAETAIIISPTENQSIIGVFQAEVDWTSEGPSATCAYVYNDFGPTVFSGDGWTEVDCGLAGSDIPAPNTDGEHTLRVAAWLGAGFTSNATSDYVTFTYTSLSEFSGLGAGTELDPYQITSCAQLQEMNYDLDAHYVLSGPIDCSETETWNGNADEWESGTIGGTLIDDPYVGVINNGYSGFEPIGQDDALSNFGPGFTGTIDGQGYTISDLWIFRKETEYNGLFGFTTNATINNIILENPRVVGDSYTGGFVGYGSGVTLENLTNTSGMVRAYLSYYGGGIAGYLVDTSTATGLAVTDGNVHGSGNIIGGLVGYLGGSNVTNSTTSASVDGGEYIGGAFGDVFDSQIDNVDATGSVDSNDGDDAYIAFFSKQSRYTGGFAGSISDSTVQNSTATGLVTGQGDYTGGFAGRIDTSDIFDSSATGGVSGNESVGGFAGTIFASEITDSSATGGVESVGGNIGGFAGQSFCESIFLRVSASGNVTAGNGNAGGFVGFDGCEGPGSTFNQVSAHGNVYGNNVIGGFIGESYGSTFVNVYSSGSVSANDQVGSFAGTLSSGNVTNAYARGLVILRDTGTLVGGFANDASNTVFTNSFWDGEAIEQEDVCNSGACLGLSELTTFQALTPSMYTDAGWDFEGIWEMNTDNNGYPHFFWENFEYEEPELLSLSAADITQTSAVLRGRVVSGDFIQFGLGFAFAPVPLDEAGESLQFIGPSDEFDEESGDYIKDLGLYFDAENMLTCGTTYYYTAIGFQGLGMFDDLITAENELSFTTLDCGGPEPTPTPRRRSSGGQASSAFLVSLGITLVNSEVPTTVSTTTPSLGQPGLCSTDQILTQNLRAPSRNGVFNSYTKGIVREAKILQAHLNRLGFNSGPEDGILGPISTGAIKRMQTFLGTKADGFVGPITRGLLNNSCGSSGLQKTQ